MRTTFVMAMACAFPFAAAAHGSAGAARDDVQRGIKSYRAGDFKAAAQAFADADVALPDDTRIAFNQACAAAAQGDEDKAAHLLHKAALSRDGRLAARCHYNLGCVAATKAKTLFGDDPEEASTDLRREGLQLLLQAVGHYRDCLRIDPRHAGAKHNIEIARLWIKHMQNVWAERDRNKRREDMNLLEFLQMIQTQQEALHDTAKSLAGVTESPRRRQGISATETAQRQLAEEIEPLKEKITSALQPPPAPATAAGAPAPPAPNVPDRDRAVQLLTDIVERARQSMLRAAHQLSERAVTEAVRSQSEVLDALNEIYMIVAPVAEILGRATATQQELIQRGTAALEMSDQENAKDQRAPDTDDAASAAPTGAAQAGAAQAGAAPASAAPASAAPAGAAPAGGTNPDYDVLAKKQTSVEQWSGVLRLKAERELEQLRAAPGAEVKAEGEEERAPPLQAAPAPPDQGPTMLQKAVELGPKVQTLAGEAAERLSDHDVAQALPKQEEALRLLKEIAASLPKQEPRPQENQDQQNQDRQDSQGASPDDQQASSQDRAEPEQDQRDLSAQEAEAVLSKVRERERRHQEMEKQLRGRVRGQVTVDKDW